MKRIILVATSHVAEESVRKVEDVISRERPDCVAVELDQGRLAAMRMGGGMPPIKETGVGGFVLFYFMKKLQEWLGGRAGIFPGSEMLKAVEVAERNSIPVAFIDRDIRLTLSRIKSLGWKEKSKLLFMMVKGVALMPAVGRKVDLRKLPPGDVIDEAMLLLEMELPEFYNILVAERDRHMAAALAGLVRTHDKVVAVVGAGHLKGMKKLLGG